MRSIKHIEIRATRLKISEDHEIYATRIGDPETIVRLTRSILEGVDTERFLVFLLDVKNKIIGYNEVARGGPDACPVDVRMVFRAAIVQGASGVIVAHNHPSGDPTPSDEDLALTKRLVDAGELLGLTILDHVIVAATAHVSLREKGAL